MASFIAHRCDEAPLSEEKIHVTVVLETLADFLEAGR